MSSKPGVDFDSFNKAVDEFYSSMEIKKSEVQVIQNVCAFSYMFSCVIVFFCYEATYAFSQNVGRYQ